MRKKQKGKAQAALEKIKFYDRRADSLIEDKAMLEALVYKVTPTLKADVVASSPSRDKHENNRIKLIEIDEEINRMVDLFVETKRKMQIVLHKMEDQRYFDVLDKKYFKYKELPQIAEEMGYGYRNICYLHGEALKAFEELMEDNQ